MRALVRRAARQDSGQVVLPTGRAYTLADWELFSTYAQQRGMSINDAILNVLYAQRIRR